MRTKKTHTTFIKHTINRYMPNATVYLFGSRVNDSLRGGDIDILVIGDRALTSQEIRNIKIAFYKQFGEQKIDILSFRDNDPSNFKELALLDGVEI